MEKEKLIQQISENCKNLNGIEIPEEYKSDLDVAMAIAKTNGAFLRKMDSSILNKQIILEALKSNFYAEKYISDELYDDKDIVLFVVNKNGHLLWKASDRLIDDIDVVTAAVKNDPDAIKFASKRLKESQEVQNILNASIKNQQEEDEKYKKELEIKVEEFKIKPIWWQDEKIVNHGKLENEITPELIDETQKILGHKLPNSYLSLLNTQNGGRLIKKYYYLPEYHDSKVFEIDSIFGIGDNNNAGIIWENRKNLDYVNLKNVVIFGDDASGGHAYYFFDYNEAADTNEPKIIYYDLELDKKIVLASNFKEFVSNLKIKEEIDLIYW